MSLAPHFLQKFLILQVVGGGLPWCKRRSVLACCLRLRSGEVPRRTAERRLSTQGAGPPTPKMGRNATTTCPARLGAFDVSAPLMMVMMTCPPARARSRFPHQLLSFLVLLLAVDVSLAAGWAMCILQVPPAPYLCRSWIPTRGFCALPDTVVRCGLSRLMSWRPLRGSASDQAPGRACWARFMLKHARQFSQLRLLGS